jgi:hypothetical protein
MNSFLSSYDELQTSTRQDATDLPAGASSSDYINFDAANYKPYTWLPPGSFERFLAPMIAHWNPNAAASCNSLWCSDPVSNDYTLEAARSNPPRSELLLVRVGCCSC